MERHQHDPSRADRQGEGRRVCGSRDTSLLVLGLGGTIGMRFIGDGLRAALSAEEVLGYLSGDDLPFDIVRSVDVLSVDSIELGPRCWSQVMQAIDKHQRGYDAVVVLSGTDALVPLAECARLCGAAAWNKPVIWTGAMKPIGFEGSDAKDNLIDAIQAARAAVEQRIGDVVIVFGGCAMLPSHAAKVSGVNAAAFRSYGAPSIATKEGWQFGGIVRRQQLAHRESTRWRFSTSVFYYQIGLGDGEGERLRTATCGADGLILITEPSGAIPESLIAPVETAIRTLGFPFVVLSCVPGEKIPMAYGSTRRLLDAGAISAFGMPRQVALARLSYLIGSGYGLERIRGHFATNADQYRNTALELAGEWH